MATIPVYRTWTAGEIVTAAEMNSNIRDAGNFWLTRPYCYIYNNAGLPVVSGTSTLVPWDSEIEDNDGMHSTGTNPSRLIFQTTGVYLIMPALSWPAASPAASANGRNVMLRLNSGGSSGGGSLLISVGAAISSQSGSNTPTFAWTYRAANIGDYIETFAVQNSGGTISTVGASGSTHISALWEIA